MIVDRYVVTATRADQSTITRADLHVTEAVMLLTQALATDLAITLTVGRQRLGVDYCDNGPILTLDESLAWRQPADALTALFRDGGAR